jgi:polyhydroxyalkanoate synthase subunit PhaC
LLSSARNVLESVKRDVARTGLQARNGIKHVAGINRMNVAQTPKEVIWERRKSQLWRYQTGETTQPVPIVIVYSLISRSYMFDLYPGHSFVEHLCNLGYDVYLLDWGVPDQADAANDLEMYTEDHLPAAVSAAQEASGSDSVILLGYCFGGTLSLLSLAARDLAAVAGLIVMATPVDYHKLGLFTEVLGPQARLNPSDLIDGTGNVPASASRDFFNMLKPTTKTAASVTFLERMWDDDYVKGYQAMGQWTRDHIPFPGATFRQTVRMLFRSNSMMNNTVFLSGRRVDMKRITVPVLIIVAEKDHIVPLESALPAADVVGSEDVEIARLPFGHVGLIMGRAAAKQTIPTILDWVRRHTAPSVKEN